MNFRSIPAAMILIGALGWTSACSGPETLTSAEAQSGPEVIVKLDFDTGQNPTTARAGSEAGLLIDPNQSLSGRSLQIRAVGESEYIGGEVAIRTKGAQALRVAFMLRATALDTVSVNVFDEVRNDNTTPASPARVFDEEWHPVVFRAEDFHYNSDPPDQKISLTTDYSGMRLYGRRLGPASSFSIDKLVVYRGRDAVAPAAPASLEASGNSNSVALAWREPADNIFAVTYSIYRRAGTNSTWQKIGESHRPRYRDTPASTGTYSYRVTAADYENNVSAPSAEVTATTATVAESAAAVPNVIVDRQHYADNVRRVHARGAATQRPDVFVFAGDSLTAASEYTFTLGSWLGRGLTVRQGVGMVKTDYGAANISTYLGESHPEFAVILYGTNDGGMAIADSMRNLGAIVDACLSAGTIPILTTIPPRGFDPKDRAGQERFNKAIVELARTKQVPVSYAFEEMIQRDLKQMLYDGIHLTPGPGNDAAGRALRQTMDQVYFALRDTSGSWQ